MPAPRPDDKTPIQVRTPAAKLALTGIVPLIAVLVIGPLLARPGVLQFFAGPARSGVQGPMWAGQLDNAQIASTTQEPSTAVRSTSYTTGFDPAAVGLVAPKSSPGKGLQLRTCADESTDLMHPNAGCAKPGKASALPQPRPSELKPNVVAYAPAADKPAPRKSNGLFGFMPRLPTARQLLSPFTFVGDKVSSLFKRS